MENNVFLYSKDHYSNSMNTSRIQMNILQKLPRNSLL